MKIGSAAVQDLESSLIHQLRVEENISRVELSRRMSLAPSTVGQYVDRLIGAGFLREGRKTMQPAGRPPTVLELNPQAGRFIGIDFEGRQILAVVVDFAQQPISHHRVPLRASDAADDVIRKIEHCLGELCGQTDRLLGIGIGVPGAVETHEGIGLHYDYIRNWKQIPLRQRLEQQFGIPVHLENNIRAMALAEQLFGRGRGVDDFVCVGIRSGIAAGVVIDGRLHSGPRNLAGEIGSWPCGRGTTIEQVASLNAISEDLAEAIRNGESTSLSLKRNRVNVEDWLQAARSGDELTLETLWRAGQSIGKVISQMNLLLNPDRVILAGPLGELEEEFVRSVRETVEEFAQPPHATMPEVSGSQLGEYIGALGGAALAARQWNPVRGD